jgi:hypothetical protein
MYMNVWNCPNIVRINRLGRNEENRIITKMSLNRRSLRSAKHDVYIQQTFLAANYTNKFGSCS